jgi:predicted XRE-type DNA-binding protein
MNIILESLKQNNLKSKEFFDFLEMSKSQFDFVMRKQDPIYMKGMESKLKEFLHWKIKELQKILAKLT